MAKSVKAVKDVAKGVTRSLLTALPKIVWLVSKLVLCQQVF
jgi:hypothetical protein